VHPGPPEPPPGPGVVPPFPAPPVEGRSARLWWGLGAAGLATLLCCGGGLAAGIGLGVTGARAIDEQAQSAVGEYLDALRSGRYGEAYEALCPRLRERETPRQFASRMAAQPRITEYDLGETQLTAEIVVPAEVRYAGGEEDSVEFGLEQDTGTGELEVCRIDE